MCVVCFQVSSLQYENIVLKKSIERMERKGEEDLEKFCKKHQVWCLKVMLLIVIRCCLILVFVEKLSEIHSCAVCVSREIMVEIL